MAKDLFDDIDRHLTGLRERVRSGGQDPKVQKFAFDQFNRERAQMYKDRGVAIDRDIDGVVYPRGQVAVGPDFRANRRQLGYVDAQVAALPPLETPEMRAAKERVTKVKSHVDATKKLRADFIANQAPGMEFFEDEETGEVTVSGGLADEIADLERTARKRVGVVRGVFSDAILGDSTPEAVEAEKKLRELRPKYQDIVERDKRLREQEREVTSIYKRLEAEHAQMLLDRDGVTPHTVKEVLPHVNARRQMEGRHEISEREAQTVVDRPAGTTAKSGNRIEPQDFERNLSSQGPLPDLSDQDSRLVELQKLRESGVEKVGDVPLKDLIEDAGGEEALGAAKLQNTILRLTRDIERAGGLIQQSEDPRRRERLEKARDVMAGVLERKKQQRAEMGREPTPSETRKGLLNEAWQAFRSGYHGLRGGFSGARALVSQKLGDEEALEKHIANYRGWQEKVLEYEPTIAKIEEIQGISDAGRWGLAAAAQMAPIVGAFVAGGLGGAKLGALAAPKSAAAGAAIGSVFPGLGTAVGAKVGAAAPIISGSVMGSFSLSYAVYAGDLFGEAVAEGHDKDRAAEGALKYGLPAAAVSIVLPAGISSVVMGAFGKNVVKNRLKASMMGALVSAPSEGLAEGIAEEFVMQGEEFITGQKIPDEERHSRRMNAAAAGTLMGFGMGTLGGAAAPKDSRPATEAEIDAATDQFLSTVGETITQRPAIAGFITRQLEKKAESGKLSPNDKKLLAYLKKGQSRERTDIGEALAGTDEMLVEIAERSDDDNFARYSELDIKGERSLDEDRELTLLTINKGRMLAERLERLRKEPPVVEQPASVQQQIESTDAQSDPTTLSAEQPSTQEATDAQGRPDPAPEQMQGQGQRQEGALTPEAEPEGILPPEAQPETAEATPPPSVVAESETTEPARPKNTPRAVFQDLTQRFKPTKKGKKALRDYVKLMKRFNPEAFEGMRIEIADKIPNGFGHDDSPAVYLPKANTLVIDGTAPENQGDGIIRTLVHESFHFAEKFAGVEDVVKSEWAKLNDQQMSDAWFEYSRELVDGATLRDNSTARSEWFAFQATRVLLGETKGMDKTFVEKIQTFLDAIREIVKEWVGDPSLTTEELDARILELLGYEQARAEIGQTLASQNATSRKPPDAEATTSPSQISNNPAAKPKPKLSAAEVQPEPAAPIQPELIPVERVRSPKLDRLHRMLDKAEERLEDVQRRIDDGEFAEEGGQDDAEDLAMRQVKKVREAVIKEEKALVEQVKIAKPEASTEEEAESESAEPITDFGEKIGGARKDYAERMSEAEKLSTAKHALSKVWPEPDYAKMVKDGADPFAVGFIRAARDEVPAKPRQRWKVARYVSQLETLRGFAKDLLAGKITKERLLEKLNEKGNETLKRHIVGRADLYAEIGHDQSLKGVTFEQHHFSLYRGEENVTKWIVSKKAPATAFGNWPQELGVGNTREEALDDFRKKLEKKPLTATDRKTKFEVYQYSSASRKKGYYIGKKIGTTTVDLFRFDSIGEAREFMRDNYDDIVARLEAFKQIGNERREANSPRIGDDHRDGKNATPEQFQEAFGFRGVEFGNYVEQKRRQDDLNRAYDSLMDLAAILNLPPKALSLEGKLGLAFGARGRGGKNAPAAHYEPGKVVINLTKNSGPGSLAHEWWHALDNYFNIRDSFATESSVVSLASRGSEFFQPEGIRPEMVQAFGEIVRVVRESGLPKRSQELDRKRSKDYWSTMTEMSARSFENYVIERLAAKNAKNDYLANIADLSEFAESMLAAFFEEGKTATDLYPYLTQDEVAPVSQAFDRFFETVKTKETDKGVMLFAPTRGRFASLSITPEQDRAYLDAVKKGDKKTAQKMVDEAAKAAGYDVGPVFHGTDAEFDVFSKDNAVYWGNESGFFFTDEKAAKDYAETASELHYQASFDPKTGKRTRKAPRVIKAYLRLENPEAINVEGDPDAYIDSNTIEGDAIVSGDTGTTYIASKPSQIKSADPVTRDASGSIIPLSQRFNPESASILSAPRRVKGTDALGSPASDPTLERPVASPPPAPPADSSESAVPGAGSPEIDSVGKRVIQLRGMFESASDVFRRTKGLEHLGEAIDQYFDQTEARTGTLMGQIQPIFSKIDKLPKAQREAARKSFADYQRHANNGRQSEANAILESAPAETKELVATWKAIAEQTGAENQKMGVKVFDSTLGKWRPIGKIGAEYFPRMLNQDVQKVLSDPSSNPELWNELVDALMAANKIEDRKEAVGYINDHYNPQSSNDHFSNLEKARKEPLPERFYDYSPDVIIRYMRRWADRISQIEAFGQKLGQDGHDVFDQAKQKTLHKGTRDYINQAQNRVYNLTDRSELATEVMGNLNMLATGLHLGNPATALLNFIGGTSLNIQAYGVTAAAKALLDMRKFKKHKAEGIQLGVLRKDFLMLMRDTEDISTIIGGKNVSEGLRRFANATMTWGGYLPAETFIRMHAMLAGRHYLHFALEAANKNPASGRSKRAAAWFRRNGFEFSKLILENGSGVETERFLRYASNLTQGSYRINQTPIFVDSIVGRFLLKYQKFSTQLTRMFWKNHLQPFVKAIQGGEEVKYKVGDREISGRAYHFLPLLRFFTVATMTGAGLSALRETLFGYNVRGPLLDEIEAALEDDDTARSLALIADRAWHSLNAVGGLGLFSIYGQLALDVHDRQRAKNPVDPPGLASIKGMGELGLRFYDQGTLTTRDIERFVNTQFAFYRNFKALGVTGLNATGVEVREAKLAAAYRDRSYVRALGRRFAEAEELPSRRRSSGGFAATPMTPISQSVAEAIMVGDSTRARLIIREHLATLEKPEERTRAMNSLRSSIRLQQPVNISGQATEKQRRRFLAWAKKNVSPENWEKIQRVDREYRMNATRAGLMSHSG